MAYTVGQVEVDVFPNAKGWDSRLASQINPAVEAIGRQIGDQLANDVRDGIRRGLLEAKVGDSPTIKLDVDTAGATADLIAFRAEADAISEGTGDESGGLLARGLQTGIMRNSPLIAAGIAGGLALGAPAVIAGAGLLFGGIAIAAEHSNAQVQAATAQAGQTVQAVFQQAAASTVPMFVAALGRIGSAATQLEPQFRAAFSAMGAPIDSLTTGVITLVNNAMPGLVAAVKAAGPVFQGLSAALASIGTGLGQFFQLMADHSPAAGQAFAAVGQIVGQMLPILGQLVGQGAELAANVLPPLAAVLGVVSHVLDAIAPALPAVLAGFLGFKAITLLTGPLGTLSAKLQTVAADSEGLTQKISGGAASAVSKLGSALPALGVAVGGLSILWQQSQQQIAAWAQALLDGGNAAAQAQTQMGKIHDALSSGISGFSFWISGAGGMANALGVGSDAMDSASKKAKDLTDSMSPLQKAQQDVTKATNDYVVAVQAHGAGSLQAAEKSQELAAAQSTLVGMQDQVKAATEGATSAQAANQAALQGIANTASSANTAISLLKGALDALTGANVTADQAQIAVTQAVSAAAQAVKDHSAALQFTNGQLDLSNDKSAAAAQLLMGLASAGHQQIATLEQQGVSTDVVNQKSDALRQQFIVQAQQLGATAQQAKNLADRYFGIPGQVSTNINAYDNASPVIQRVQSLIAGLKNKDIFITTYSRTVSSGAAGLGGAALPEATGGIVKMFAGGGFNPMSANIAQVVPPGTLRVIGDNPTSDEAYIPINDSARSLAILSQTANRMGYAVGALSGSDGAAGSANSGDATINIYDVGGVLLGSMRGEILRANGQAQLTAAAGSSRAIR